MKKTIIFILLTVIGVVLLIPTLIFVSHFRHSILSTEINDWGAFGSYISGTLGTLISFFSLIILGYITYIVGKNSNKESKNLFLLKKRIEAYDELMKYIPKINSISVENAKRSFKLKFNEFIKQDETPEDIYERYLDILKSLEFFPEFHYFLFNFNARYNHIFKYDFNSSSYKELLQYSNDFKNSILLRFENFDPTQSNTEENNLVFDIESFNKMTESLIDFINELKKELE